MVFPLEVMVVMAESSVWRYSRLATVTRLAIQEQSDCPLRHEFKRTTSI